MIVSTLNKEQVPFIYLLFPLSTAVRSARVKYGLILCYEGFLLLITKRPLLVLYWTEVLVQINFLL